MRFLTKEHLHQSIYMNIYMAQVLQVDKCEVYLRYLEKKGNLYSWPVQADELWQPAADILCKVQQPDLVNNRGQLQFKVEDIESAKKVALNKPGMDLVSMK